jgi:nitrite reductase (NO-forming)
MLVEMTNSMNKRYSMLFSVTAVAVLAATLFGSTYTQTQTGSALAVSKGNSDLIQAVHDMGGLKFVMPEAFAAVDCANIEAGRNVVNFDVTAVSADLPIMGGTTYKAMTFSGQVPGPTLRVTQGDVVKMTLTIPASEPTPHGNDMHASQMSAGNFGKVLPGASKTYCYVAEVPGTFKYHCSGVDVAAMDQHVLSGMYGITIVDPIDGYKSLIVEKTKVADGKIVKDRQIMSADALEFQLQYNQLYLTADGSYDMGAMFQHHASNNVVNGISFGYVPNEGHNKLIKGDPGKNIFVAQPWNSADLKQYQSQLLFVEQGQHARFFVENQGNEPVFFHIVGEIIDRVMQGNVLQAKGTETWLVGGSQGMIADVVFDEPGVYVAVNHDYAALFTGAASVIVAGDPFALNKQLGTSAKSYAELLGNPSDAIPPMGKNSIAHPKVNLHGLYTDERAAEIATELGI